MCMHARMRRLVWSGDGTYVRMAGARQNMRVRIPSNDAVIIIPRFQCGC